MGILQKFLEQSARHFIFEQSFQRQDGLIYLSPAPRVL